MSFVIAATSCDAELSAKPVVEFVVKWRALPDYGGLHEHRGDSGRRLGEPYPILVPLTTALCAWAGLWLREERLRALLPFRRKAAPGRRAFL
jgi:hypothetical protein